MVDQELIWSEAITGRRAVRLDARGRVVHLVAARRAEEARLLVKHRRGRQVVSRAVRAERRRLCRPAFSFSFSFSD